MQSWKLNIKISNSCFLGFQINALIKLIFLGPKTQTINYLSIFRKQKILLT